MKNYKSLLAIVFLSIFAINVNAEVLIPSDEDKESLMVYLVKDPSIQNPIFTNDIDNNLTISKSNQDVLNGRIYSNICLLTDFTEKDRNEFSHWNYDQNVQFYEVSSMYEAYGISNLTTILSNDSEKDIVNFAKSLNLELEVKTICKGLNTGTTGYATTHTVGGLFFIPDYLYRVMLENSPLLESITQSDILGSWTFDEMMTLSNNYLEVLAEEEKGENEFQEMIANLAEQKSKDFMGSLFLSLNDYGSPKFCTLNYSGDDAVAAIGYRLLGDEMIPNSALIDYYNENEITLNINENYFDITFDDINSAFSSIKSKLANYEDYCNIFIDYPENLLRLKNALERDLGGQRVLGNLFDISTIEKQYAIGQGFDNYDQYNFAYQIDADYTEIKSLENYQISNLSEFNKVQDEIGNIGYSNDTDLSIVLTYLDDLSNAQQQNMDVNEYRDARVNEEYANDQGFDNYDQYNFAYQIDGGYREVKSLENYQISNLSEFNKVQDEIKNIGYSNDTGIRIVLTYLDDLSNAQQENMDVNEYRDARIKEEERLAKEEERLAKIARDAEAKRQADFAREYPYTATLTCGMSGGDHINIVACFVGSGSYGIDTELEITNGQNYQMYKPYNLSQAGSEYYNGLEINLRNNFKIFAQNSSEYLVLSLKIVDNATGATLYQDSASQYGVINISN